MASRDDLADLWPVLGLTARLGPLELRGLTDDDLVLLGSLAESGIHEPDAMPFYVPWSVAPAGELRRNVATYHWGVRAAFKPEAWELVLGTWYDGVLVGCQGLTTKDFLVTRTGETGSWLGRGHQGRGIGTLMRQTICMLAFDHLGFEEVTSGAFLDNPASLAVSRKVGYRVAGVERLSRAGELALNQHLVLDPADLVRPELPLEVEGVAAVRRLIGLDSDPGDPSPTLGA